MKLILASSSPSRKKLLERLKIPFSIQVPDIDESPHEGEDLEELVRRLSIEKAEKIAKQYPDACVIGSDQLVCVGDTVMGKPKTLEVGREHLRICSGNKLVCLTAMTIIANGDSKTFVVPTEVQFRELSDELIDLYIQLDDPLECAGCIKAEGAGPLLFESITGEDPAALIGLPLNVLAQELLELGFYEKNGC